MSLPYLGGGWRIIKQDPIYLIFMFSRSSYRAVLSLTAEPARWTKQIFGRSGNFFICARPYVWQNYLWNILPYNWAARRQNQHSDCVPSEDSDQPGRPPSLIRVCPGWSESSLSAWRKVGSLATHWAHTEDSDQTGRMPRLIWVFAGCSATLLVLSCRGSYKVWNLKS